ncbi:hypothetical protein [Sporolactobacillus sp. KGMB 08714]|uniref:hypothetical protein n=1 Tax=Sporolactobacillus sp. KGMB 08714 TaxID=3064704 RepID=UPI002FBE8C79
MEDLLGFLIGAYIGLMLLFGSVGVDSYSIQMNKINEFRTTVNETIQKEGGLTDQATATLQTLNRERYNGMFTVESLSGTAQLPYGTEVDYKIIGKIGLPFFNLPPTNEVANGSSVSLIRGS